MKTREGEQTYNMDKVLVHSTNNSRSSRETAILKDAIVNIYLFFFSKKTIILTKKKNLDITTNFHCCLKKKGFKMLELYVF